MYDVKMEDDFDEIFHHEGIEEEVKEPRVWHLIILFCHNLLALTASSSKRSLT